MKEKFLSDEVLEELPVMCQFPTIQKKDYSHTINVTSSEFYQTEYSICYNPNKPISKILINNE